MFMSLVRRIQSFLLRIVSRVRRLGKRDQPAKEQPLAEVYSSAPSVGVLADSMLFSEDLRGDVDEFLREAFGGEN